MRCFLCIWIVNSVLSTAYGCTVSQQRSQAPDIKNTSLFLLIIKSSTVYCYIKSTWNNSIIKRNIHNVRRLCPSYQRNNKKSRKVMHTGLELGNKHFLDKDFTCLTHPYPLFFLKPSFHSLHKKHSREHFFYIYPVSLSMFI